VVSREEVDLALRRSEQVALGDDRMQDLTPAERDAVAFPSRLLAAANGAAQNGFVPAFSQLAREVGRTKDAYPDQV